MKTIVRATAVVAVLAGVLSACSGAPQSSPSESSADRMYSRTVVTLHPDGTNTQVVTWVTEEQMIAQRNERLSAIAAWKAGVRQPFTVKVGCEIDDVQLWDQAGATGDTICFVDTGNFDLSTVPLGGGSWWAHVRSYSGAANDQNNGNCNGEDGYFATQYEDGVGPISCGQGFSCNGGIVNSTTNGCAWYARWIVLTD